MAAAVLLLVHEEVFQLDQSSQMELELRVAPAREFPHVTPGEAVIDPANAVFFASLSDQVVEEIEKTPGLGRQFIQRSSQKVRGQFVGELDVVEADLDVLDLFALVFDGLDGPLVLVQKGNGPDEGQILLMIPAGSRFVVAEGELFRVGIGHQERPQKPLGVAMALQGFLPLLDFQLAWERFAASLQLVDEHGLLAVLIDGENQAAVE